MPQAWRILTGLAAGLFAGASWAWARGAGLDQAIVVAELVGGLWLDLLRMTIVPLVVALLVTGIARTADSMRGGRLALHSVLVFVGLLWLSTAIAALLVPALLAAWPMPAEAASALREGLSETHDAVPAVPGVGAFLRSIVPTNPIAAAAGDALLPLILFTTVFAVAVTRLPAEQRASITAFFSAIADAMLVVVGWVLWLAPAGVLALAFAMGAHAGASAFGALFHYIAIVSAAGLAAWAMAYPTAVLWAGIPVLRFVRATAPAQAVALSTQSSLASLPAMLKSSETLGVPMSAAGVSLPIAVAIFRVTSPAMNLAVALYVAHWFAIPLDPATVATGAVVAAITTIGSVSLPGQVSFLTSITPIALAMGVPIEPLALLIAVEMVPDLVRTVGNVTMDVAATAAIARSAGSSEVTVELGSSPSTGLALPAGDHAPPDDPAGGAALPGSVRAIDGAGAAAGHDG
jgi:Na+/H+-dicarboxylate symporter